MSKRWILLHCSFVVLFGTLSLAQADQPIPEPIEIHSNRKISLEKRQANLTKLNKGINVDFKQNKLHVVLTFIAANTDVNMNVQWTCLQNVGVEKDTPITLKAQSINASDVLGMVLAKASERNPLDPLAFEVDEDCVVISTRQQIQKDYQQTLVYDLSDIFKRLTPDTPNESKPGDASHFTRIAEMIELIRTQTGQQADWVEFGGNCASVHFFNQKLIVKAHRNTQEQVQRLLWNLRHPGHRLRISHKTGPNVMDRKLEQIISVDFHEDKLETVLNFFAQTIDAPIDVNWHDLKEIGVEPDLPITLKINDTSAGRVLDLILQKISERNELDPLWHYQSAIAIEIASKRHLYRRTAYLRSYDIRDLLILHRAAVVNPQQKGQALTKEQKRKQLLDRLITLIRQTTDPKIWEANGGDAASVRELNGLLLVRAPQPIHTQIKQLLESLRTDSAVAAIPCKPQATTVSER